MGQESLLCSPRISTVCSEGLQKSIQEVNIQNSAIRKKILPFVTVRMDLENIMLSE